MEVTGELSILIYPEVPVLKVGLKDKVKGARMDLFELVQQTRVPYPIEGLSEIEKNTSTILFPLKERGNGTELRLTGGIQCG